MNRTIKVTGRGELKIKPDMTEITITLEGFHGEYAEAVRQSAEDTECLRDALSALGFARGSLKTLSFHVNMKYENDAENGMFRQRLAGYEFRHAMRVEFEADNDVLGRVLYALANCPVKPEYQISYTLRNPEAAREKVLGMAVADAREKAAVLASAAGIALKDIQSIDHSLGGFGLEPRPMANVLAQEAGRCIGTPCAGSYGLNIESDDIELSDTVTIVWEIA